MFPASAGMNRPFEIEPMPFCDVPRERGDEPIEPLPIFLPGLCSPRARG